MDAMMRSYSSCYEGRDIINFSATSKKLDEDDLKRLKVPRWVYGNIAAYNRGSECVMISDVYMKEWGGHNGNAIMSKFIAGLLRGKIVVGNDERSFGSTTDFTVAAKSPLPSKDHLGEFDGAYPFVVAITCRPSTSEIIFIKEFGEDYEDLTDHEKSVTMLHKCFNDKSMPKRFLIIRNRKNFEQLMNVKLCTQISECLMHLERLATDWRRPLTSTRNRKWFLAGPQMPNLYRTMKIALDTGSNAWSFDPTMSALLDVDLEGYEMGFNKFKAETSDDEKEESLKPKVRTKTKEKQEEKGSGVMALNFNPNDVSW